MKKTNTDPINSIASLIILILAILLLIQSCELNKDKNKNCGLYNGIKQCD